MNFDISVSIIIYHLCVLVFITLAIGLVILPFFKRNKILIYVSIKVLVSALWNDFIYLTGAICSLKSIASRSSH